MSVTGMTLKNRFFMISKTFLKEKIWVLGLLHRSVMNKLYHRNFVYLENLPASVSVSCPL